MCMYVCTYVFYMYVAIYGCFNAINVHLFTFMCKYLLPLHNYVYINSKMHAYQKSPLVNYH